MAELLGSQQPITATVATAAAAAPAAASTANPRRGIRISRKEQVRLFKKNVAMVRTPSVGDIRNKEPRKGCIVYKDEKERQKLEQALEKVKATTSKVPAPRYYGGLTPKVSTATLDTIRTAIVGQLET